MLGNLQVRFGGGRMEKGCNRLSSDLETGISHSLASRLPDCRRPAGISLPATSRRQIGKARFLGRLPRAGRLTAYLPHSPHRPDNRSA